MHYSRYEYKHIPYGTTTQGTITTQAHSVFEIDIHINHLDGDDIWWWRWLRQQVVYWLF